MFIASLSIYEKVLLGVKKLESARKEAACSPRNLVSSMATQSSVNGWLMAGEPLACRHHADAPFCAARKRKKRAVRGCCPFAMLMVSAVQLAWCSSGCELRSSIEKQGGEKSWCWARLTPASSSTDFQLDMGYVWLYDGVKTRMCDLSGPTLPIDCSYSDGRKVGELEGKIDVTK